MGISLLFFQKKKRGHIWVGVLGSGWHFGALYSVGTVHNHEGQLYIEASTDTFEFKKF